MVSSIRKREKGERLIVVPRRQISETISLNHDSIFAAHPGWKRTLNILQLQNWWPEMKKDLILYVRMCDACQRKNGMQNS
jgi:hypothetical protein